MAEHGVETRTVAPVRGTATGATGVNSSSTKPAPRRQAGGVDAVPGPAPERKFRPDIEGLRAIAVLTVVLYHAKVPWIPSGFIGVDVFFVISGFLITGLLVRERLDKNSTSIVRFYARRARRILPASTLVVLFTLFASYHWLGFISGNSYAVDAKWTSVFSANLRFGALQTTYLGSQAPPSPFQQMWSLGVEEQFYIVWPTVVLTVALVGRRVDIRNRLAAVLTAIVIASFAWSVLQTSGNATWAYFSPLTRAWELGLGGLVAVAAPWIRRLPALAGHMVGAIGLAGVIASALVYDDTTAYPGSAAALPVVASALLIAGGTATQGGIAESILGIRVMQWLGARSYSLYLWHWPLLVIAAQSAGHGLSVWQNLAWVGVAIVASALTYSLVENPVRFARPLMQRPWLSVGMGVALIAGTVLIAQWQIADHYGTWVFWHGIGSAD